MTTKTATHLIDVIVSREVRLPEDELSEDAPDGPDVDGVRILVTCQHDFGGAVPSRHDVLRQQEGLVPRVVAAGVHAPRQPEVAYLEVAVAVNEQVRRLEVAMEDVAGVDVLETAQHLVGEVLDVID